MKPYFDDRSDSLYPARSTPGMHPVLSLAQLEEYDPDAPKRERERRFLCPLCGDAKPRDAAHRSLCTNVASGAWTCKRCGARGKLREFWTTKPLVSSRDRARIALESAFSLKTDSESSKSSSAVSEAIEREQSAIVEAPRDWLDLWNKTIDLAGTPGAEYIVGRGIDPELARFAGTRFSRWWQGGAAVVFPLQDHSGELIAVQGRHIVGTGKRTRGEKRRGVFEAKWRSTDGRIFSCFEKTVPVVIVCEAPLDALSVAMAGYPALALCGTSAPDWIHRACAFRRVALAFDDDAPGDAAAVVLERDLSPFGAHCERLRPVGNKDWNEVLQEQGRTALEMFLVQHL